MSYRSELIDNIYLLRMECFEASDTPIVLQEMARARRRVGRPLVYIVIMPESCEPPDGPTRKVLSEGVTPVLEYCEVVHIVIEGTSFKRAIIRTLVSTMATIAGKPGKSFYHATLTEALAGATAHIGENPTVVLRKAISKGFVTPKSQ